MGWATGSSLMSGVIDELEDSSIGHAQRVLVYEILIEQFESFDCDTLDECVGSDTAFDEAMVSTGHDIEMDDEDHEDEDDE